jgi:putative ABC transport system permease protein
MPPRLPHRIFRWFCHPKLVDHIEGDLLEVYGQRKSKLGKRRADLHFTIDVFLLCRPGIIRPAEGTQHMNAYGMYKSYLKIGWRNLVRQKGYSIINISGLAIGITVAILNGLWVWDEVSFNKQFENHDRIAQVSEIGIHPEKGHAWRGTTMTYPLATELMEKYNHHFKRITRLANKGIRILASGDALISARGLFADDNAPELFTFTMRQGVRTGLSQPQSIMISGTLASALFGTDDPLGRTIRMNNKTDVTVTGVFEDFAPNSEFNDVRFVCPWSLYISENKWIQERAMTDWRNHFMKIYVEIPEGQSFPEVTQRVKGALHFAPADVEAARKRKQELDLYPMSEWHLRPSYVEAGQLEPMLMIKLVSAIGMFVLGLACINFVNLSTARAEKRSKEVGIRKTIGSVRTQLIGQFFSESFLVVTSSFVIAIGLTQLLLPTFNHIAAKSLVIPWTNSWFWLAGLAIVVATGLLAGGYPALYLSSFNPVQALKGTFRAGRLASLPRKVLVVFQFSISVVLIIGTAVVYQQIQFAKNRPVGYDREGLVMVQKRTSDFNKKYDVLRTELKNTGVVYEVSESMGPVTDVYSGNDGWDWKGKDPSKDESFGTLAVSHLHGKTAGWQFVQGNDFDPNISDSSGLVINETALKLMGLENPIGEPVTWTWWQNKTKVLNYKIIGVIRDMVMESPYQPIEPTAFYLKGHNGTPSWIHIKISPSVSANEALPKIESVFKKVVPTAPFEYKFADEEYALKFAKEERIANLATFFATLAIFISCLGLLGLSSYVAETRTKEIGIRKVLGATVTGLWRMMSRDFVWLVLTACALSAPLAYYLMELWLENFVYRTELSVWVFVGTAVGAISITLLTISYQAIRAATANPVNSLRSE